jgi:hypothetical protein
MNGSAGSSRPKNQKQELIGSSGAVPASKTESGDPVVGRAVRIVESGKRNSRPRFASHYDAKRACHYNYIANLRFRSAYRLISIGDGGAQRQVAEIPVERQPYMQSFGMSEEHLILSEIPLVVNPVDLRLAGKPFIRNYRWEPERGLHFHVVEKDTGRIVRSVTADAGFAFHHVNAFPPFGAYCYSGSKALCCTADAGPGAPPPSFGGWAGANVDRPGADFANFDLNGAFRAIAATHARRTAGVRPGPS